MSILKRNFFWFGLSVVGQVIMVIIGFSKLVTDGQHRLLMGSYDGMRNYFAYHEFVMQRTSKDYFIFEKMNYPFGDYIFYTDNTPLFAVLIRFFSENIYDVSGYSFQIYHWILCFSLVPATILLYLIGKDIIKTKWLLAIFSMAIPWITPQLFRLGNGHFGLAFSCCLLATIYGLVVLYQRFHHQKSLALPIAGLIISVVLSAFIHMYYLVISGFFIGYFCLTWAMYNIKNRPYFLKMSAMALGIPLACLIIVLLTVLKIDTYYPHRVEQSNGFHFDQWQLKIEGLYDAYDFLTIPFLKAKLDLHYESVAYLGSFAWYTLGVFLLIFLFKKLNLRPVKQYLNGDKTAQLISILLLSGIACLIMSFGAKAHFFNNTLIFNNILNPLYWLEKIIPQTTHFRCMARFNWMFYLTFNFFLLYVLDKYTQNNRNGWQGLVLLVILPLFMVVDTFNTIKWYGHLGWKQPLNNEASLAPFRQLLEGIDPEKYQALLTLPYFNATCEDYDYTIDSDDTWSTQTFLLSHLTDLPLIACKTGRTPLNQTRAFFEMFVDYKVPELIESKLTQQPILVIYNTTESAWKLVPTREPARTTLLNGRNFAEKMNMKELKREGVWILYEWTVF